MARGTDFERLLRLARKHAILTIEEVKGAGIHTQALTRAVEARALERVARGRYQLPGRAATEHHGLALAAAAVPRGVVCLISALAFHGIGTRAPFEVWIAIDRRARQPTLDFPPLRAVRFSGRALTEGVEAHQVEGQAVRVYSVAKTLADVFEYRNKIGVDVALEALREAWRDRRFSIDEVDRYARACRVERVIGETIRPTRDADLLGFGDLIPLTRTPAWNG